MINKSSHMKKQEKGKRKGKKPKNFEKNVNILCKLLMFLKPKKRGFKKSVMAYDYPMLVAFTSLHWFYLQLTFIFPANSPAMLFYCTIATQWSSSKNQSYLNLYTES